MQPWLLHRLQHQMMAEPQHYLFERHSRHLVKLETCSSSKTHTTLPCLIRRTTLWMAKSLAFFTPLRRYSVAFLISSSGSMSASTCPTETVERRSSSGKVQRSTKQCSATEISMIHDNSSDRPSRASAQLHHCCQMHVRRSPFPRYKEAFLDRGGNLRVDMMRKQKRCSSALAHSGVIDLVSQLRYRVADFLLPSALRVLTLNLFEPVTSSFRTRADVVCAPHQRASVASAAMLRL